MKACESYVTQRNDDENDDDDDNKIKKEDKTDFACIAGRNFIVGLLQIDGFSITPPPPPPSS